MALFDIKIDYNHCQQPLETFGPSTTLLESSIFVNIPFSLVIVFVDGLPPLARPKRLIVEMYEFNRQRPGKRRVSHIHQTRLLGGTQWRMRALCVGWRIVRLNGSQSLHCDSFGPFVRIYSSRSFSLLLATVLQNASGSMYASPLCATPASPTILASTTPLSLPQFVLCH